MLKIIKDDLWRYEGDRSNLWWMPMRYVLFTPGFQYTYLLRHAQYGHCRLFWKILLKLCGFKFGFQIPPETKIGRGLLIGHFGSIVVNPATIIGDNFNVSNGVTIGNAAGKRSGTPVIGNNVCINANACVVGGITIGDDVLIAPNAFVNFDVPSNSIVVGNPGKIIPRDSSPTAKYIVYPVKK